MLFHQKTLRRGRFCALLASVSTLPLMFLASGARAGGDDCGLVGPNTLPTPSTANLVICNGPNETSDTSYQDADGITYATANLTLVHQGDGSGDADLMGDGPTQFIQMGGAMDFGAQVVILSLGSSNIQQFTATSPTAKAGIYARSDGGPVSVRVYSDGVTFTGISTQNDNAQGIEANSNSDITVSAGAAIATTGANASGIWALSGGYSDVRALGTISTTGINSFGIENRSTGEAGASTYVAATITTTNSGSIGVSSIATVGASKVELHPSASVSTVGNNASGVVVQARDLMTVNNHGSVSTVGDAADGIFVKAIDANGVGNITVRNWGSGVGNVSTTGLNARGIYAQTRSGYINILTSGLVSTTKDGSTGIFAKTEGANGGDVFISVTGEVRTQGNNAGAVQGEAEGALVSVTATKTTYASGISTIGNSSTALLASSGGSASVANNGMLIETSGNDSDGLFAYSTSKAAQVRNQSEGEIITTGDGSHAMFAAGYKAYAYNYASVSTDGITSHGVYAKGGQATRVYTGVGSTTLVKGATSFALYADAAGSGQAFIRNSGSVETQGNNNKGLYSKSTTNQAIAFNYGAITVTGTNSKAIVGSSASGVVNLLNFANITTTNTGATGIDGNSAGFVYAVHFSGTMDIQGDNSVAIIAQSTNDSALATVSGAISSMGAGSDGIVAASSGAGVSTVLVQNSVTVADTGVTLISPNVMTLFVGSDGTLTAGGIAVNTLGAGSMIFENHGMVEAQGPAQVL